MSTDAAEPPRLHLTIRPGRGWAALDLAEIWQFRDLLLTLAGRDLKLRYKQTALGMIWVVLAAVDGGGGVRVRLRHRRQTAQQWACRTWSFPSRDC